MNEKNPCIYFRFLLKDGQLWLCEPQAKQLWTCLAEHAIYVTDRESCFRWFSKVGQPHEWVASEHAGKHIWQERHCINQRIGSSCQSSLLEDASILEDLCWERLNIDWHPLCLRLLWWWNWWAFTANMLAFSVSSKGCGTSRQEKTNECYALVTQENTKAETHQGGQWHLSIQSRRANR